MRSAASIKSHPIHPILVTFPFAYLTGGFVAALAGAWLKRDGLTTVSRYLVPAGIAAGLAAAVPGIIDYTLSVPPESSARERAAKHGLINSSALALFAAATVADRRGRRVLPLALQALGTATLSFGSWLGGTLVHRNQIGIDHRYANAGRWDEKEADDHGRIMLETGELEVNQMQLAHMGGERVAIGRTEKGYVAFQDRCTHKGGPLSDGALIKGCVQCPWHGSQFDVHTGAVECGPAEEAIDTYGVKRSPDTLRVVTADAISRDGRHRREPSRR